MIRETVHQVLENYPKTRWDDVEMFCLVNIHLWNITVAEAAVLRDTLNKCVSYESCRRTRQIVQAQNRELKPDYETENLRQDRQEYMRANKWDVDRANEEMRKYHWAFN